MRYSACTFLLVLTLLLSNTYAQEYTTWGLPNGAKARLGKGRISTIRFSPDGSQIAVAGPVGIWLYDARTGKELALLPGHKEGVSTSVFPGIGGVFSINVLAFSPDSKLLASASEDGTIRLLDLTTYLERHTLLENKEAFVNRLQGIPITALVFSADGKTLTSLEGIRERRIKVWDVNSGRLLSDISGRKGVPLIPDGQSRLTLNNAADLMEYEHDVSLETLALSPDGTTFAAIKSKIIIIDGVPGTAIRLGNVRTGNLRPILMKTKVDPPFSEPRKLQSTQNPIKKLVFSPGGTMLAGVETKVSIAKNPDIAGEHIRTTRSKIRIWDVGTGNQLSTVIPQQVDSQRRGPFVVFSPDGKTFATANEHLAAVQLWEVSTGDLISNFTIPHPEPMPPRDRRGAINLTFSADGKTLAVATAGGDSSLRLWEVSTGEIISTLAEHPRLTVLPINDRAFISVSTNGTQLRDIHTGKILRDLTEIWTNLIKSINEIDEIESSAFSLDNTTLAVGGKDGSLQLWNVGTQKQPVTLVGHTDRINTLAFTTDGTRLASGSRDRSLRIWDVRTGTLLLNLTEHINSGRKLEYGDGTISPSAEWINNLSFSPDGRTLASASALGTIWLWDLSKQQLLTTLTTHEAGVPELPVIFFHKIGLAFSLDGTRFASGGENGSVMLSEVSANPNPLILKGHHAWSVKVLAFSPDSKYLVSGSRDNSIRLWDVETGTEFTILRGHVGAINALAFSADGLTLISGSIDGTILLWDWEKIARQTNR